MVQKETQNGHPINNEIKIVVGTQKFVLDDKYTQSKEVV